MTTGGGCLVWWIFWNIFVFNNPEEHPRISEAERDYISSSIGKENISKVKQHCFYYTLTGEIVSRYDKP